VDFLGTQICVESTSQVLRILPRRGMTAWVWRSLACLPIRRPNHPPRETIRSAHRVLADTVGQFAGQGRPGGDFFAHNFLAGFEPVAGTFDGHFRQAFTGFGVVVQPQAECVLDHTVDKGGALPGGEALLGLAGKLGIGHLGRQHIGATVPDIIGRQFDAPGDQFAKLTEFANGGQQARTKTVDVGAALGGGMRLT
jgi:hypothetical protein